MTVIGIYNPYHGRALDSGCVSLRPTLHSTRRPNQGLATVGKGGLACDGLNRHGRRDLVDAFHRNARLHHADARRL